MPELRLLEAEKVRAELTAAQEKQIRQLYMNAAAHVREWSSSLEGRENISSILMREYLSQMEKDLIAEMERVGRTVQSLVEANMLATASAVVTDMNTVLNSFGISLNTAYSFVPADAVQSVVTGRIYAGNWSLSQAIWGQDKKIQQDIHTVIAQGIAENKSAYDIAKDLEQYVNPTAAKPFNWGKIYPNTNRVVDYNAQRLARTMVSHAYQQSFVQTTKDNPFFEGYHWLTANNHRVCPLCRGYAEDIHGNGLPEGVFPKDDLPLDHPNGQCTFSVYMTQTTDQIVDTLARWAHGEENSELDSFAESLGFPITTVKSSINT